MPKYSFRKLFHLWKIGSRFCSGLNETFHLLFAAARCTFVSWASFTRDELNYSLFLLMETNVIGNRSSTLVKFLLVLKHNQIIKEVISLELSTKICFRLMPLLQWGKTSHLIVNIQRMNKCFETNLRRIFQLYNNKKIQ